MLKDAGVYMNSVKNTGRYGMQVYLMFESGCLRTIWLSETPEGKYFLRENGAKFRKDAVIEAKQGKWYLCEQNMETSETWSAENLRFSEITDQCKYYIRMKGDNCILYAERVKPERLVFHNYGIAEGVPVRIGRAADNDVVYPNESVTRHHATLIRTSDGMLIQDHDSLTGTFVNGRRIKKQVLHIGDIVFIMGLKIIIGMKFISVNDGNGRIQITSKEIRRFASNKFSTVPERKEQEELLFNRLPRKKKNLTPETITIESPPFSISDNQAPMILSMGGSMVMGGSALMRGNVASVLSMLLFPVMNRMYTDKDKKEYEALRKKKYSEYLENKRKEIWNEKIKEETVLNETYPPLNVVISYPSDKKRLWERGYREEDFLRLRIGYGEMPLKAEIKYPEQKFNLMEDPLEEKMFQLAHENVFLDRVPIMLSLTENFVCGVIGNHKEKEEFLRRMIMRIAFLHSYDEVKLVLLLDQEILETMKYVRFLPHIWDDEKTFRFLATDTASAYLVGEYLNRQIEQEFEKTRDLSELLKEKAYYVVLAWNKQIFDKLEILKRVMKDDTNHGVSVVTFFEEVPQYAQEIINLHSDRANEITYLKESENYGEKFVMDDIYDRLAEQMIQVMLNTKLKIIQGSYVLPKMITFLELFGAGRVEYLNPLKRWKENDPVKSLAAPVGVASDGSVFLLDLHEKYQGPHGLVAGMTGSGKSEFIITYILSLALNFHPDEVSFVLIDYKGGGLAGAFEDPERGIHLPHLVGTITNLDGAAIQRSLMSIESELKRREKIFAKAKSIADEGTMDIYTYQKLYRNGKVKTPLPHLFIISDEFAELKSQEPEFMDQLVSAARIGRSLGVHLILATQKPAGVVSTEINSNSKFRVCLKVQTRADSDEMLRRPEAAELKETGRFYLQVGYNEYFALGQSAWCGAPYTPQDEVEVHRDDAIQFVDDAGQNIVQVKPEAEKHDIGTSQLVAIVKYLTMMAERERIHPRKLWMEPLQKNICIQDILQNEDREDENEFIIPLGKIDDPENQKQYVFHLNLRECRNYLIIGGNQSGKTTLLQTILYTAIRKYSPEDINFYVLDYSGGLLQVFSHAVNCGGVWLEGEEEQAEKMFDLLKEIIAERKEEFLNAEVNNFDAYRKIRKIPLILVAIDNIAGLSSWKGGKNICYDLHTLIREGNTVGIKFLITAGSYDDVMYNIKKEFGTRFVLDAKNRFEYGDILGVRCRFEPPRIPGRGLLREEERALECQIAKYMVKGSEQQVIQQLKEEIKQISQKYGASIRARQIKQISETETYEEFLKDILPNRIPLGYSVQDMKKVSMPLKQLYCMSVYFGNTKNTLVILENYILAAFRDHMHLFIVKRNQNSVFEKTSLKNMLEGYEETTFFETTKEDGVRLWKELYQLICDRKQIRNEYCDIHNLSRTGSETMKMCFHYMQSKTWPLLVIFESFRDFCNCVEEETKNIMQKIFEDGRGYNYYFMGCYYPDDTDTLRINALQNAFNRDKFVLLYGGQFHRQGLISLPMEYRNVTKPSKKSGSCLLHYHEEIYPVWMPSRPEEIEEDPDDAAIIG